MTDYVQVYLFMDGEDNILTRRFVFENYFTNS